MTELSKDLIGISEQLIAQLEKMINLEGDVRTAFLQNDYNLINNYMNTKQASIMALRQLEDKRLSLFKKHDIENITLTELLPRFEKQEEQQLVAILAKLKESYTKLEHVNKISLDIVNKYSQIIEKSQKDSKQLYGIDGKKTNSTTPSYSISEKV